MTNELQLLNQRLALFPSLGRGSLAEHAMQWHGIPESAQSAQQMESKAAGAPI